MLVTMLLLVVFSGAVLCAQSAINGRLGAEVGVLESAWLTFALGTLVSFLYAFLFEPQHAMNLFNVPRWQVSGAFFGVVYMLVIVFAMPRVGTAAATVAVISGQLLMSLLVDHFGWFGNNVIHLGGSRMIAVGLLAVALVLIYKSNTVQAEAGRAPATVQ
ncbi:DMT family transporter [Pseudomonas putida]|uniref:DMT family transporter n=1 Tax=Pseudomonas putida TaxID=303 RepID=A0A4D6X975_PSEPU|nr:DMT family transporter [Pseudomonas putida]QCI12494.1 DMT family transporter [Pseudomonas putida]